MVWACTPSVTAHAANPTMNLRNMSPPPLFTLYPNLIWWEDFKVGDATELGRHTFSEQEIVAFGRQYDPQPFHIDPEKAKASAFGGLIASGWQTCAVGMRLMVDGYISQTVSLGSPGIDSIRWLKPVRPGDTVTYSRVVTASRAST